MKIERKILISAVAIALALMPAVVDAAESDVDADSFAVSVVDGNISFSSPAVGSVTATILGKSSPMVPPAIGNVVADLNTSGGAFVGNYTTADIRELSVKVTAEMDMLRASELSLILRGASGRTWRNSNIQLVTQNGDVTAVSMLLERAAGWSWNGSGDKDALWAEDLASVSYVGLTLAQTGDEQQIYTISDLTLLDTPSSALAGRVQDYFGTSVTNLTTEEQSGDDDGDGMNNWDELLAGTDPGDANSIFAAELDDKQPAQGVTLTWPCVTGGSYSVLRADDTGFNFSVVAFGLTPDSAELTTGVMSYNDDSATGEGPYFFKIVKE